MKILVYTYRTYPYITELKNIFGDVFVINKIKDDLEKLSEIIKFGSYDIILGIANSTRISVFEAKCINNFHNKGKVLNVEENELFLKVPKELIFKINSKPSDSFCNYSMFRIKYFLSKNNINISFYFVHLNKKDIDKFKCFI